MRNDRSYWKRVLLGLQTVDVMPTSLRLRLLRMAAMTIDETAFIESGVTIVQGPLTLGADCYVNRACLLDCRGGISIGDRTLIAPRVTILTATHPVMPGYPRAGPVTFAPVNIGTNCWVGAGAIILPGVTIGEGTVVAAGSLVRESLASDKLYAGTPAKIVRELGPTDR